jgi:hypothetical protein
LFKQLHLHAAYADAAFGFPSSHYFREPRLLASALYCARRSVEPGRDLFVGARKLTELLKLDQVYFASTCWQSLPPPRHKFDFSPRQFVPQFLRRSWQTVDANALIANHFSPLSGPSPRVRRSRHPFQTVVDARKSFHLFDAVRFIFLPEAF